LNKKVMIVDDEPDMHEILKMYLRKIENLEVISAYTGEEGVKKYKELYEKGEEPSLVIMDLNLSGRRGVENLDLHMEGKDEKWSGVQTTKEILKINPNATIWGYTAWFDTKWTDELLKAGAKKVIKRPIPFKEVAKMVKEFFEEQL